MAEQLLRSSSSPSARRHAGDLLLALAVVECHVSAGEPVLVPPGLLRELVIITARLAGRSWLGARPGTTAAFAALLASRQPPPLPDLDQILARLLSDRFGLALPAAAP